ncbi:MAG: hypothetical protein FIA99_04350 [Ruminiclostridium sp.]|nr:hypothetical protein [Ruminiclostridium sp.]
MWPLKVRSKSVNEAISQNNNVIEFGKGEPFEGLLQKGMIGTLDLICPTSIDTTKPDCLVIDGIYSATLLVCSYHFELPAAWLADIISFGEGIDISIYIEPLQKAKVVKDLTQSIGITRDRRKNAGDNQSDVEIMELSIDHAKYIRERINKYNEDPYYIYILITVYAASREKLEDRLKAVETKLGSKDMISRRADFRHEQGFLSTLPLCSLDASLKKSTRRNALTSGVSSIYPFTSYEFCDENGILFGKNEHNNSLIIVDIFNSSVYKNANMVILGTSGSGKSFTLQLIALRLRMQGIQTMIICPLKGHEFVRACKAIGGQYIKLSPASSDCINIMEIRKSTCESYYDEGEENISITSRKEDSLLLAKIQKLHIFFSLLIPDMTAEEKQHLDDKLLQVYARKGITCDNESLYSFETEYASFSLQRKFKEMPVLGDLYILLESDPLTKRIALLLKKAVSGSFRCFNNPTNVDLSNKYIVADISELKGEMLPVGMFIALDLFWDRIKEDRTEKKAVFLDELWTLIGSAGNRLTAEFVLEIFKIIRGYGGSAIGATQDISDFFALEDGKYGKGIINNAKIKMVLQLEEEEAQTLREVLKLTDEEMSKVTSFPRGHGLFYANANHAAVEFKASDIERQHISSDREELAALKRSAELRKVSKINEDFYVDRREAVKFDGNNGA